MGGEIVIGRFQRKQVMIGVGITLGVIAIFTMFLINQNRSQTPLINNNAVTNTSLPVDSFAIVRNQFSPRYPQGIRLVVEPNRQDVMLLSTSNENVEYTFEISEEGWYQIALEVEDQTPTLLTNRIALQINGQFPYFETRSISLPARWNMPQADFPLDRYGNEVMPIAIKEPSSQEIILTDSTALTAEPFRFYFTPGRQTVSVDVVQGSFSPQSLLILSVPDIMTYEESIRTFQEDEIAASLQVIPAEDFVAKSNPSTRLIPINNPLATSYDTRQLQLSVVDGYSFRQGGDTIYYNLTVEETGWYNLSIDYRQNYLMQMPVFRELRINGKLPFAEMQWVPFHYSNNFQLMTLGGDDPYWFYLEAGSHELSLRTVLEPYRNSYHKIVRVMDEITDFSLEIKRLTGNTQDRFRNWKLEEFIPDASTRIQGWIIDIQEIEAGLGQYSNVENPGELTNLGIARRQLETLLEDIDDVPNQLLLLSDGDASAAQLLGTTAQVLLENGLDIEAIYVSGDEPLPRTTAFVWTLMWEELKRFVFSFGDQAYGVTDVDEDTLEIWVNYPRQYIEILQQQIDQSFTPQTGIDVQLSIMPDENKLILANAANAGPDVALGVNHWVPYEFAIRGASLDLRQFNGFETTVNQFAPGVMIPYAFEEGIFGLPATQNFWVTFYRTDIIDSLGLPVPQTWDEVIEILPELQRFGMNYYHPISMFGGFKPFVATIPFIYQFDGQLYTDNGMQTLLNSDENIQGVQMMTELFTIYNVPKEVPNFYNHFRTGLLPIGISDLSSYLQLTIAAPEIAGQWQIAPHPGVLQPDGTITRYAASGAQSMMILSDTTMPDESWAFIEWFMETQNQVEFAYRLQTAYGTEFLWNTANLEAFRQLPLPAEHIDVILAQWEYAMEASRIPGYYMVERELSNGWNKIVFDDENPRITLDNAVRVANREIVYRMEEFGYVEEGIVIRPYRVPTIYNISEWLTEHTND
jgi:ABC-type glycerol-3-phosphate transport system substrate-binding protein